MSPAKLWASYIGRRSCCSCCHCDGHRIIRIAQYASRLR